VIAEGRASEILDLGGGSLLRRFKTGGNPEREALVMRQALEQGYPVPRVFEVGAGSLVIERVEGPTMLQALFADPSSLAEQARTLAQLHDALHAIEAPASLRALGDGDRLLHFDLHPENVILGPAGPVVIDWANACRGEGPLDVVYTWIICATSDGAGQVGLDFVDLFLEHFDRDALLPHVPLAAEHRLADVNVTDEERDRIRELAARASRG